MTDSAMKFRVMLVDDHPIVRQGMRAALEKAEQFSIVGEADNAEDAISAIQMLSPDLVLLDIRIKGGRSGIEVASELTRLRPEIKIIALTNHAQEPYLRAMIEAGVTGYLLKDTPPSGIIEAISRAVHGERVFSEALGKIPGMPGTGIDVSNEISSEEAEVLQLHADGRSNEEIGSDLGIDVDSVQAHLERSFARLGQGDSSAALRAAADQGIIVLEDLSA